MAVMTPTGTRIRQMQTTEGFMTASAEKTIKRTGQRRKIDKRGQLLNVASKFFLKHGYEKGSINALARTSGISKESIYRYFKSKEQLFEAVIEKELENYTTELGRLMEGVEELNELEGLTRTGEAILKVLTSERTLAMRRLIFQTVGRNPEIGRHYYKIGPRFAYKALEKYFENFRHDPAFSPAFLAHAFVALLLHEVMLQRECGVLSEPSASYIRRRARITAQNFSEAYLGA
jgi:TetR/AcrR family transcriptional repressor of mexJK operon